jgi:transposase
VREFLGLPGEKGWRGKLVCDDFSGYKACFELGVTEVGCMAHARRKFHELWANHGSQVGENALKFFGELYDIEREVVGLDPPQRQGIRQEKSSKVADALHQPKSGSYPVAGRASGGLNGPRVGAILSLT